MYSCYELLGICSAALQEGHFQGPKARGPGASRRAGAQGGRSRRIFRDAEMTAIDAVARRLGLLQAVSPGCSQHATLSATLLAKTGQLMGRSAPETQEALESCVEAHSARYGPVSAETLARLVDAHERNDLVELLAKAEPAGGGERQDSE